MSLFKPLYPPEGAPVLGYYCCTCHAVKRTRRGIDLHVFRKHGLRPQREMFDLPDEAKHPEPDLSSTPTLKLAE